MTTGDLGGKKRLRRLMHKTSYLRLEIEEKTEELKVHERDFEKSYWSASPPEEVEEQAEKSDQETTQRHKQRNIGETAEIGPEDQTVEVPAIDPLPDDLRMLWKQIAFTTHPDRTGGDLRMSEAYKRATAAYNEDRLDELLEVALELGIEIEDPSESLLDRLEARTIRLEEELKKINDSVLWDWAHAPEEKKKKIESAVRFKRRGRHSKKRS